MNQPEKIYTTLPGPAPDSRCDRDAGERAVARVHTPDGPLDFCGHHLRENYALFQALGYGLGVSEVVHCTPYEIDPDSVRLTA